MGVQRAFYVAKRERENIRISLKKCGDAGEFDPSNSISGISLVEGLRLIRNITEMENKLGSYGYFTAEAAYVFANLASGVVENLGLRGRLAQIFGSGYSWVRTGYFGLNGIYEMEEQKYIMKQLFFFKLFFPIGGDCSWDFDSAVVKTKLKLIYHMFTKWQDDPGSYTQDVRDYEAQLKPLLRGLTVAMDLPAVHSRCRTSRYLHIPLLTPSPESSYSL